MRFIALAFLIGSALAHAAPTDASLLVIIVDGLRPDYVTPELMPNLHAASERGVFCENHHSVYPTVTRVNSSTFGTGMYPKHHGLLENTIYIPSVDERRPLSTSSRGNLLKVVAAEDRLLTTPTLGERLAAHGIDMLACSAGSAGSAFLMNYTGAGAGVIHYNFALPESRQTNVVAALGPEPPDATPSDARNAYATNAYIQFGLKGSKPKVTYIWLTDPDHTAHGNGMGDPITNESIRLADRQLGRIIAAHKEASANVNVFVTSDHGFSTHNGGYNPVGPLIKAGIKRSPSSDEVIFAGGAVYVRDGNASEVAEVLMADANIGAIFSPAKSPGSHEGVVPGTLTYELIHWNHPRSGDLLVGPQWSNDVNEHGYAGSTTFGGTAGHGSASPWDIHNTLVAFGPDIKENVRSAIPTGNVDIAPTMAYLAGLDDYHEMDGRPLTELLRTGPALSEIPVESKTYSTANNDKSYRLTAQISIVEGKRYLDFARADRD